MHVKQFTSKTSRSTSGIPFRMAKLLEKIVRFKNLNAFFNVKKNLSICDKI